MKFLDGYKSYIAAAIAILTGLIRILQALLADPMDVNGIYEGALMISGGLGIGGIAHKVQKSGTNSK